MCGPHIPLIVAAQQQNANDGVVDEAGDGGEEGIVLSDYEISITYAYQ